MEALPPCRLSRGEGSVAAEWPRERPEVAALAGRISRERAPLRSALWETLIDRLCDGGFPLFRLDVAAAQCPGHSAERTRILTPLLDRLNHAPLEKFRDINQLCAAGLPPGMADAAKALLFELLLDLADRRLQRLYRFYLALHHPSPGSTHAERVDALYALEGKAYRLLDAMDLPFLARWLSPESPSAMLEQMLKKLSNYFFDIKKINFRFTHHCNIACRHCYNSSGPSAKALSLSLDEMLGIIGEMPRAGIGRMKLTGGEPFLYMEKICRLVEAGRKAKLRGISIFTNGFWAKSIRETERYLLRLQQAGFMQGPDDTLKMSAGEFHQAFIPAEQIFILAETYHRLFGKKVTVDYEASTLTPETKLRFLGELHKRRLAHTLSVRFREVLPVGRGSDIERSQRGGTLPPCGAINQLVFDPDGSARPCCGLNSGNRGLVIGNIRRHDLGQLVKSIQNDPILQFIATTSLERLYGRVHGERRKPEARGLCPLCQESIGHLDRREPLQNRLTEQQAFYPFRFSMEKLRRP